jgi:hypothetical protein
LLARYTGIWGLAWRLLVASVGLLLLYSVVTAGLHPLLVLLTADRGLELTIAIAILVLFLFVHYYHVPMESAVRDLAIGFFSIRGSQLSTTCSWKSGDTAMVDCGVC